MKNYVGELGWPKCVGMLGLIKWGCWNQHAQLLVHAFLK